MDGVDHEPLLARSLAQPARLRRCRGLAGRTRIHCRQPRCLLRSRAGDRLRTQGRGPPEPGGGGRGESAGEKKNKKKKKKQKKKKQQKFPLFFRLSFRLFPSLSPPPPPPPPPPRRGPPT